MLSPNYLVNHVESITNLYADFHTATLEAIARHIADTLRATGAAGVMPSTRYQIERANAAGLLREEIIKKVAELNSITPAEVRQIFEDAAVETMEYENRVYTAAGLVPIPVMQSPEMLRILDAGISKTMGSIERLTGTIAINTENRFYELLGVGYNKVATGGYTYNKAIEESVDELARNGIREFRYDSGVRLSIEAAVRMNVLTGANQTGGQIVHETMEQMGADLCRTTAHLGARNTGEGFKNHESWQGKVFSLRGKTDKYDDFYAACGYGHVQGIYGANCKHSHGVYIEGLSTPTYSDEILDDYAKRTVTYNGKEMPYYDATQYQRNLERRVRHWDRIVKTKEAAGLDASAEKIGRRKARQRVADFVKQTGLKRDTGRERAAKP